ncbi:hypothetical protein E2L06_08875 [Haloterrigena sp. H1]|uniref:molybdopterin-dependent oxidoreductase n=1 Tax=Haloterrigena sp. H1 TaxID=2552943 RepID=UPI00110F1F8E|nr:molybdopterin-dependent oxidoreductase [Haloterrigena sp. H1]TMT86704.1 hypothetical protein E2L06_08875 [Haloterrigena sp. H1]
MPSKSLSTVIARVRWAGSRAIVALLVGVVAVTGSFAVSGRTPSFVVAPVDAFVVTTTPAIVVTFAIEQLGRLGETLASLVAVALTIGLFAVVAQFALVGGNMLSPRLPVPAWVSQPTVVGAAMALFAWLLVSDIASAVGTAVPAAMLVALASGRPGGPVPVAGIDASRRQLLALTGGAFGFGIVSYAIGSRQSSGLERDLEGNLEADATALSQQAADMELEIDGIPGLISESSAFFTVDINNIDPVVNADDWTLTVTGEVDTDYTLTYDDLVAGDVRTGYNTLRCVGEQLNADLLDNAIWTAVPVAPLLERAGPSGGCECVRVQASDGYYQQFPLAAMERGYLAFGMNGKALPRAHGHPVRLLIPGHWGEINVKWVTEFEVLEEEVDGYWEERGWHGTGPVNTIAKLWTTNELDDGRMQVGGHAYAGTRGIETVEVSTDGGDSWTTTELSEAFDPADVLGDRDVWRQWQYTWEPPAGDSEVVVRAIDGTGDVQPEEKSSPFPSGSSGWVRKTVSV